MKISWTPTARRTYFEIIDHLEKAWTAKEILNFIKKVDHLLEQIKQNPIWHLYERTLDITKCDPCKQIVCYICCLGKLSPGCER